MKLIVHRDYSAIPAADWKRAAVQIEHGHAVSPI
jgi:hypothetical protein